MSDSDLQNLFKGFRVEIVASEEQRSLPSPDARRSPLPVLKTGLLEISAELYSLQIGKRRTRKIDLPGGFQIHVSITRAETGDALFFWRGGRVFMRGERSDFVTSAVHKKIQKRYRTRERLWLIVYMVEYMKEDADLASATKLFEREHHDFEQAWFFFPFVGRDDGETILLWQR